jgi:hypothetical protein
MFKKISRFFEYKKLNFNVYSTIMDAHTDAVDTYVMRIKRPLQIRMWKLIEIIQKYPRRFDQLSEEFGEKLPDATILAFEDKNTRLILNRFLDCNCRRFVDLRTAINHTRDEEIIINVTDIGLYGVFSIPNYYNFISNIYENAMDDPVIYNPQQIILTGWAQKIVFLCKSDEKIIEKVRKYVKKCFGEDITVTVQSGETTISVNKPLMKDFCESSVNFQKLIDMIARNLGNNELAELDLRQKQLINDGDATYQSYALAGKNPDNMLSILKELHSIRALNLIVQVNGDHNNVVIGCTTNNINADAEDVRKITARNWISKNPPTNLEKKSDYYQRYRKNNVQCVADNIFGKLVGETDLYTYKRIGGTRHWCKK